VIRKKTIKKEAFEVIHLWGESVIGKSIAVAPLKQNTIKPTGDMSSVPVHGSIRPST
jgi:hypothetical protein